MPKKKRKRNLRVRFESAVQIDPESMLTNLCLASLDDEGDIPTYYRLAITDSVVSEFQRVARKLFDAQQRNLDHGNFSIRPYDAVAKLDTHEVEHLSLTMHRHVRQQIEGLSDVAALATFSRSDETVSNLRFYVIVLEPDAGQPVYLFRSCSPRMELQRSSKIAIIFARNQYDTFDESLFVFDRGVDCMAVGNDMYVFNKGRFETIFQFFEEVREAASETLETIRATIPIHNFDELESACLGHIQMLKKLKNIANQPYLDRITMNDIKKVVEEMDLSLQVNEYEGVEKLTFDPKDKWEILRLLDDDYLKSVMTGENYEVNSKRRK